MKNKTNLYKVLSSSVIAAMLTVSLGAGIGHAEEGSIQPDAPAAVTQDNGATATATTTEVTTTADTIETIVDETVTNQTTLLPGDLFYFFKALTEKIKLALADKDLEKAMLLVQYTQERINEADALFKNGEEDLAYETIQKALKLQGLALEYSDDASIKDDTEETKTEAVSENTTDDSTKEEKIESETKTEDDTAKETEKQDNTKEEQVKSEDKESTELEDVKAELEEAFTNNVHGLLIAIQNVKNPKALKALTRNLERQAKKYEKRYGKILKAEEKYAKVVAEVDEKVETGEISKEEADQKIAKVEKELVKKQQEVKAEVQKDFAKESKAVKEEGKAVQNDDVKNEDNQNEDKDEDGNKESKYEMKQYKEELKHEWKMKKEELKHERKMKQEEFKAEKKQVKEERKQEHQKEKHEKKGKDQD